MRVAGRIGVDRVLEPGDGCKRCDAAGLRLPIPASSRVEPAPTGITSDTQIQAPAEICRLHRSRPCWESSGLHRSRPYWEFALLHRPSPCWESAGLHRSSPCWESAGLHRSSPCWKSAGLHRSSPCWKSAGLHGSLWERVLPAMGPPWCQPGSINPCATARSWVNFNTARRSSLLIRPQRVISAAVRWHPVQMSCSSSAHTLMQGERTGFSTSVILPALPDPAHSAEHCEHSAPHWLRACVSAPRSIAAPPCPANP